MKNRSSIPPRYYNAKLFFRVPLKELEADLVTGNVRPVVQTIEALAVLKQVKSDPTAQPGQNLQAIDVKGYMGDPIKMPVDPPVEVDCIIDGRQGKLKIESRVRSPYETDIQERHCGQKIEGKFIIQG